MVTRIVPQCRRAKLVQPFATKQMLLVYLTKGDGVMKGDGIYPTVRATVTYLPALLSTEN